MLRHVESATRIRPLGFWVAIGVTAPRGLFKPALPMKHLAPAVVVLLLPLVCGCHHSPAFGTKPPPKVTVAQVVEKEITEWNEYIGRTDVALCHCGRVVA